MKAPSTRTLVIAAAVALIVGIAVGYELVRRGCENKVLARFPSPDGKLEAVTFQRSCGATTGRSTEISIVRVGEALRNEPGNVAAADSNAGKAPAGPGGGPELRVSWWGNELRVWHHRQARITPAAAANPSGVAVRYDTFD